MLKKLAPECRKCKYRDTCNHKRMVMYGELTMPSAAQNMASNSAPLIQPNVRKTINIMIDGERVKVYKDDIVKEINKQFNCSFLYSGGK